ncbi:MAG TPA: mechanosensitive ion channel domain-containing protein [Candidatus Binataceae bacterium]|nr:mechanosensitive ion channel domain-containing protein [Candidatus Binataceae bacterium]
MTQRILLTVGAALATLFVISVNVAAAPQRPDSRPSPASSTIFERRPLGFDRQTIEHLEFDIQKLPTAIPRLAGFARQQRAMLGRSGALMMMLLLVASFYAVFLRSRLAQRIKSTFTVFYGQLPEAGIKWFTSLSEIVAASLLPFALWLLWELVRALTGFEGPLFLFGGELLLAWTVYSLTLSIFAELVRRPLLPIPADQGNELFKLFRVALIYGTFVHIASRTAGIFGAPADALALIDAFLSLSLIVLVAALTLRRKTVLALLPDVPNILYRGFVRAFARLYPVIWMFTLAIALAQLAGFVNLANFLWARTWLPAGLFLLGVSINHLCQRALYRSLVEQNPERQNAADLYLSLSRLIRYAIALVTIGALTHLIGGLGPAYRALSQPVLTLGNQNVSIMVVAKAVVIVMLFFFSARLIRDYCEYRIYPQLNIDPGVANAINTFIVYVIVAIGVLASVEAVGLGLGTITLFAGAFGIGLGMGLQSMANNLTSGLTLIFTRALRKGDVVTTGETMGIIQEVGMRATRMKTPDAIEYLVPNSEFVDDKLVNWTKSDPFTRLHVPIGVSYEAEPEVVRQIMERVAANTANVEPNPPPEVRFANLGDSSLNFELLVWINVKQIQPDRVRSDLYFALFQALKECGIEIPFPQRDIRIRSTDGIAVVKRG